MTRPGRAWPVLCALSVAACHKTDGAERPPNHDSRPRDTATGGIGPTVVELTGSARPTDPGSTTAPKAEPFPNCTETTGYALELDGLTQAEVRTRFGPPTLEESFQVQDRQGELYVGIANTYPTTDPKNRNVALQEWTWTSGDCVLTVWFHKPKGTWQVLDDFFWHKDAAF